MTHFESDSLYFIPLGGSEQFGVNLNAYVSGEQILAVDCGLGFADEYFPGIDLLLPDPEFLEKRSDDLQGLIITHAHEDHIGAVARLWPRLGCPVYASPFTAVILRYKLEEAGLRDVPIHVIEPMDVVEIGAFKTQFIPVAHSIPDACALIIDTPQGRVVHSGDWNLDPYPVTGSPTDAAPFKAAGKNGVLAYIGDSTNAEVPGVAGSEADVAKGLASEFKHCKGRIIVTIFSSNIGRIISIAKAAQQCGRSVAVIGRSLHRMIGAARECEFINDVPDFIEEEDIELVPHDNLVVIMTGSQGEYRAALPRVSRGDHRSLSLYKGDTVIFSARKIPGNETAINRVMNNLSAAGVSIITPDDTENIIHVSGHPCQDEITDMLQWVKPKTVIPVHGERTQLDAHARLAKAHQIKHVIVPNNGSVIKLAPGTPEIVDHVETGLLAVDQKRIIPASHRSISGRRQLQYSGVIHVSIVLDKGGKLLDDPMMDTIGLIDDDNEDEIKIEGRLYYMVADTLADMKRADLKDDEYVAETLRRALRKLANHKLGFKPKTTVHVLRV